MFMKYFTFNEFFNSDVANAAGIVNHPAPEIESFIRMNIMALVDQVLDPIREQWGVPVRITSGYRCKALNDLVGGKENSLHLTGRAADFTIDGLSPSDCRRLACWCADHLEFDQMIVYPKRRFIHVSYLSPKINRHEVLFT